jgi:hypothetical protein
MQESDLLTQGELADHWRLAESTLERWRAEGTGPVFLKIQGRIRYRLSDIVAFEDRCLRKSTSESLNHINSQG